MLLVPSKCDKDFKYVMPNSKLIDEYSQFQQVNIPSTAVNAVNYLPKSYSKSGRVNYTVYLQKAIDENEIVIIPDFSVMIDQRGLNIKSGKTIIFQKNSQIVFNGVVKGKYWDVLKVYNVKDVKIINANIRGSRNISAEQSGEWSAGISILNSKNITIINPKIYDTYGDGIFIGSENGGSSEDIYVTGGWINNVRRNGISVTSGKNIFLKKILISNTNGTAPASGVDIEPSIEDDIITNVNLNDIFTFNNEVAGIVINMNALSVQKKQNVKSVSVNIINHKDLGSAYAFGTSLNVNKELFDAKGSINILNPTWQESRKDLFWKSDNVQSILINFKNINTSSLESKRSIESYLAKQPNFKVN